MLNYNSIEYYKLEEYAMKKIIWLTAMALLGAMLFTACAKSPTSMVEEVYRGEVTTVAEDGSILVTQQAGHNYGQESILFHMSNEVRVSLGDTLMQGAFVEIKYNGILTRSLPAQGTATSVTVIASSTAGIVQNGTIQSITPGKDGYSVTILPIDYEATGTDADINQQIILTVPLISLEGLTSEDLVAGVKVSAVTMGIAAMSMPPIMPVVALLPYTE